MFPLFRLSPSLGSLGARTPAALRAGLVLLLAGPGCVFVSKDDIAARKDLDGDGISFDQDCDDNDRNVGEPQSWYVDEDNDSFGTGDEQTGCEPPERFADNADDCDDSDPLVNPAAAEVYYNGKDDDCAGVDANGDGAEDDLDKDSDGATVDVDCDDEDPARFPDDSIPEVYYNGLDDDCNLDTADGDQDGDSYWHVDYENLVIASGERPMSIPEGDAPGDCWDDPNVTVAPLNGLDELSAADVNPGAEETHYDGVDQDCAGVDADGSGIDDDFDQDGDGFASAAYDNADGTAGGDCLDCLSDACRTAAGEVEDPAGLGAANVNPAATDVWYDGTDADCDGADDYDRDADGDAVPAGGGGDCNDDDPSSYTGASDRWYDGVDTDCAGNSDYDADGDFWVPDAYAGRTTTNAPGARQDGSGDCWDNPGVSVTFPVTTVDGSTTFTAADFNPVAADAWYDGVDLDCAGNNDFDADEDGFTSDSHPTYTGSTGADCDDAESTTNPSAPEICSDGADNDCSGHSAPCGVTGTMSITEATAAVYDSDNSSYGLGFAIDAGHDYDGDGTDDLLVADPFDSAYGSNLGTVSIYSGVPSGFSLVDRDAEAQLYGFASGDNPGYDLTGVSDMDGDGYDDLVIGLPYNDDYDSSAGLVAFAYGPVTSTDVIKLGNGVDGGVMGTEISAYFGFSVAAGDLDNDGKGDFLAASPSSTWNGTASGRVFFISGPTSVSLDTDHVAIEGIDERTYTGRTLEVGDISGDGVDDLLAGYEFAYYGTSSSSVGVVGVLEGPLSTTSSYDLGSDGDAFIYGSNSSAYVGKSLAIGDFNDDGKPDLAVGAPYADPGSGYNTGATFVYFGPLSANQTEEDADLTIASPLVPTASYPQNGYSVASGDLDGDGKDDLALGANYGGPLSAGAVYTFHGPVTAGTLDVAAADGTILGTNAYSELGSRLSVGDTDGDGVDDLHINQNYYNGKGFQDGQVLVFPGGAE
jgi:hypothetical protein